jgi:hypothetical protein
MKIIIDEKNKSVAVVDDKYYTHTVFFMYDEYKKLKDNSYGFYIEERMIIIVNINECDNLEIVNEVV